MHLAGHQKITPRSTLSIPVVRSHACILWAIKRYPTCSRSTLSTPVVRSHACIARLTTSTIALILSDQCMVARHLQCSSLFLLVVCQLYFGLSECVAEKGFWLLTTGVWRLLVLLKSCPHYNVVSMCIQFALTQAQIRALFVSALASHTPCD